MQKEFESNRSRRGGLAVELLLALAMVAILAAIALPNYWEKQTRTKVAGSKAKMRIVGQAIEAYFLDNKAYPPEFNSYSRTWGDPISGHNLIRLSTPVAYLTASEQACRDPLLDGRFASNTAVGPKYQFSMNYFFYTEFLDFARIRGGNAQYAWNGWGMDSMGPDANDDGILWAGYMVVARQSGWQTWSIDTVYDPSNGTISHGDIPRWGGITPPADLPALHQQSGY